MPTSHGEAIKVTPGVRDVTWASWFGGIYKDPKNFFGQFAVDQKSNEITAIPELLDLLDVHGAGEMVWSQRFDLELTDILTLRDEIASQTVAQVDPALMSREGHYAAAHRPTDATAYHLLLRAIPAIHRLDRAEFLKAGDLLAMAVARDPDYAPVHAWSAYPYRHMAGR